MIKTDKVIYHTKTQEEYNWLMEKLEADGVRWDNGKLPTKFNNWSLCYIKTNIRLKDKIMPVAGFDFYESESEYKDYEFIEVTDLMKNDGKDEILDKLEDLLENLKHIENEFTNLVEQEEETDTPEELEAIHKQVTSQIEDLRKQGKEPKAIEYTIKVCFE